MTKAGDHIQLRGEAWRVARSEQFENCTVLTLEGLDQHNAGRLWRAIEPFDRPIVRRPLPPRRRPRQTVVRAALDAIAVARPARGIWTAAAARVDLLAYQLEPALAVLNGATRVLLADGVGLGKTIQAGLILCELQARGLVDRALILTPSGLRDAWAEELGERFSLRPTVFDQKTISTAVAGLPAGVNPWTTHAIVIASIDLVKRSEVLAALDEAPFDLLIVDEAHHLTPGSDRGAAVERLASRTPWAVLVSATPHSGDEAAFEYLTRLGGLGDRLAVFRRTRRDVGMATGRRVHLLAVTPSPPESRMLRAAESYAGAIWNGRGQRDRGARLLAVTLARRAASSACALERTLTRRHHLLSGRGDPAPVQPSLPWEDTDESDADMASDLLCLAGLDDRAHEMRLLEGLIAAAAEARGRPSKIRRIACLIRRVHEPVVIFTEYRDTLEALVESLAGGRVAALHGGLPAPMRHQTVCAFNHGEVDILIATDTAGEGLNLHHRCRLVIDVELPWNPMRLEQRMGRVDRLGQTRRVHAVRLLHRGTVEETVLAHLERRRQRAGAAMDLAPDEWLSEEDVAAAALGQVDLPRRQAPRLTTVVVGAAAAEVERLVRLRRVASADGWTAHQVVWSAPQHQTSASTRLVLLYALRHVGSPGRISEESCCALLVRPARLPARRRDWHAWVRALAIHPALQAAIGSEASNRSREIDGLLDPLRRDAGRRVRRIRERLHQSPSREPQASLFDRRAERRTVIRQHAIARLDAALMRRVQSLTPLLPAIAPHARLIAVWPLER